MRDSMVRTGRGPGDAAVMVSEVLGVIGDSPNEGRRLHSSCNRRGVSWLGFGRFERQERVIRRGQPSPLPDV
jgi:hypothetical protein